MQKTVFKLLFLIGASCIYSAQAASIATVIAQESPVWILQGESETELDHNSKLSIGNHIITRNKGRVEMSLQSEVILWLNTNSEVVLEDNKNTQAEANDSQTALRILKGSACLKNRIPTQRSGDVNVKIGDTIFATLTPSTHICVQRQDWQWSIKLVSGNARVTYSNDTNLVGLSQVGTVLQIDDFGSFQIAFTSVDDLLNPVKKSSAASAPVNKLKPAKIVAKKKKPATQIAAVVKKPKPAKEPVIVPEIQTTIEKATITPVSKILPEAKTLELVQEAPEKVQKPAEVKLIVEDTIPKDSIGNADIKVELNKAIKKYYSGYPDQAIVMIRRLASSGDAKAQFLLGNILYSLSSSEFFSITESPDKWYKLAAAQNYPEAIHALGVIHQNKWIKSDARGDFERAKIYYQKAKKLGYKTAKLSLSKLNSMVKSSKKKKSLTYTNASFVPINRGSSD